MPYFLTLFSLQENQFSLPAIYIEQESIPYGDLDKKISAVSLLLKTLGIKPYDRVAFVADLSLSSIVLFFSVLQIGASPCLLSTRLPLEKIPDHLTQAKASFFLDGNTLTAKRIPTSCSFVTQEILLFTSGSTKLPKLVSLTLQHFLENAKGSIDALQLTSKKSCWLLSVPLFHVSGLSILFRCFLTGNAIALTKTPMQGHSFATHVSFVPTQLLRVLENSAYFPHLTCALIGGAPLFDGLIKLSLHQKFPLYLTYGMTEMASQITMTTETDDLIPAHVGKPLPGREVCLAPDGEILVRGSSLFTGYDTDLGAKKNTLEGGWFQTGDLGTWDPNGNLIHKGRKDNLFISGGENIYPETIEQAISSLPHVLECLVIPMDDLEFGQRPIAFVHMNIPLPSKEEFHEHLSTLIPRFSLPTQFFPLPQELMEKGFKIKRSDLKIWIKTNQPQIK